MKEQAEKQNRNFEDIVAERYGVSIHIKTYVFLELCGKLSSLILPVFYAMKHF